MAFFLAFETVACSAVLADVCVEGLDVYCGGFAFWAIAVTLVDVSVMLYADCLATLSALVVFVLV